MSNTIECLPESKLVQEQKKHYGPVVKAGRWIEATVRYDDQCGNGHNSFSITGESGEAIPKDTKAHGIVNRLKEADSFGCLHDEIAKAFPELAPLIKWHLCASDEPMHYVANTLYHARQHGPNKAWVYFDDPANGIKKQCMKYCSIEEAQEMCLQPSKTFNYVSGAGCRYEVDPKTAKVRNLDHARASAIWPEATDEQLCAETADLTRMLLERLPAMMQEFKAAVESLGFTY